LKEEPAKFATRSGLARGAPERLQYLLTDYIVKIWPPPWVFERDFGTVNEDRVLRRAFAGG